MTRVPGSKIQERARQESQRVLGPSGTHMADCVILQIYDREVLEEQDVPDEVRRKIQEAPGLIFAQVETLPSRRRLCLPLKEPEEHVYQVYGNAAQLNGRPAKIEYENLSMENGRVIIQRTYSRPMLNVRTTTTLADIGRII